MAVGIAQPQRAPAEEKKNPLDEILKIAQILGQGVDVYSKISHAGTESKKVDAELAKYESEQKAKTQKDATEGTTSLRKEYEGLPTSKDTQGISSAYSRLNASKADAAGDMALIYSFNKLLDPGSTVRESEFYNAQNAAGVPDRLKNVWSQLMTGTRLNPKQRESFKSQAKDLYEAQQKAQDVLGKQFTDLAVKQGYNPLDVVLSFALPQEQQQLEAGVQGPPIGSSKNQSPLGQIVNQKSAAPPNGAQTVIQNGHTYTWNPNTGQYE